MEKLMNKLIDKVLASDARILNLSWKTLDILARINLALVATGLIVVVIALLTM